MLILSPRYARQRRSAGHVLRLAIVLALLAGPPRIDAMDFQRGDANGTGSVNIADGIFLLQFLYQDGPTATCLDAADANDDGVIDVADAIYILATLKSGGTLPPPPYPGCGDDPTVDGLDCVDHPACP